jgi:hypothetical protein
LVVETYQLLNFSSVQLSSTFSIDAEDAEESLQHRRRWVTKKTANYSNQKNRRPNAGHGVTSLVTGPMAGVAGGPASLPVCQYAIPSRVYHSG